MKNKLYFVFHFFYENEKRMKELKIQTNFKNSKIFAQHAHHKKASNGSLSDSNLFEKPLFKHHLLNYCKSI